MFIVQSFHFLQSQGPDLDPMRDELTKQSATELLALIRARAASPVEIAEAHLRQIAQANPSLNAIVTLADDVLDRARAAEADVMSGKQLGPLHGLPVTVKDTIDTQGIRTTSGSRLRANEVPRNDAAVVARLKAVGAIVLGKTNTPEMAIPYESDNPVFGRTNHPADPDRTPGGSSGGEAAAIAAFLSPAGVGSDLSGSIRVPAHFCGITGLKPTTGLVPMEGHVPASVGAMSMGACVGPMAREVADLSLLLQVMVGAPVIATSRRDFADQSRRLLAEVQMAFYDHDGVAPVTVETESAVKRAAEMLSHAGLQVRDERPPAVSNGSRLWIELFSHAAAEQLREFYRGRENEAGPRVAAFLQDQPDRTMQDKIEIAERTAAAVVERERQREQLLAWMKSTPIILAPVGSVPAFKHRSERVVVGHESISVFRAFSYCQTFNVFGLPAATVPVGRSPEGLPIGVQIIGRPFEEKLVLAAAAVIEEAVSAVRF